MTMRLILAAVVLAAAVVACNGQQQQQQQHLQPPREGRSEGPAAAAGGRVVRKLRKRKMLPAAAGAEGALARGGRPVRVRRKRPLGAAKAKQMKEAEVEAPIFNPAYNVVEGAPAPWGPQPQGSRPQFGGQAEKRKFKVRRKKVPAAVKVSTDLGVGEPFRSSPPVVEGPVGNRTEDEKRCMKSQHFIIWEMFANVIIFFSVLSLFTIVSFQNDPCTSGSGNNGTCYSSSDCSNLGGTASGSCASGFGVCCLCKTNNNNDNTNNLLILFSLQSPRRAARAPATTAPTSRTAGTRPPSTRWAPAS